MLDSVRQICNDFRVSGIIIAEFSSVLIAFTMPSFLTIFSPLWRLRPVTVDVLCLLKRVYVNKFVWLLFNYV